MIESFRNKALKRYWTKGDEKGLRADWRLRIKIILDAIEVAHSPEELDIIGFGFHALTGDKNGRYAITVSRNWRITFGWHNSDAIDLDLEDYHGK
ncbi:type II toxin-antitoxin system RelE/ParE family toxin [Entomobacter blattae]|uniref:Endoribonuclease HigB n=1 Tax=Entomobacter blattae TaxID=2762277 RepID=A0A7H1NTY9_9PROT|nr:type II toxin-antitoxin system RelE/ParE family toxin [Entomobacter blattae]QNT79249.1 Endoribonuclease HigB [Entomobacter blattae]